MHRIHRVTRRDVLRAGALLTAGTVVSPARLIAACDVTPGARPGDADAPAWSGPFWREGAPIRHNLRGHRTDGGVLVVTGRVTSADRCNPVPHALLDVWHCSPGGEYFTNEEQPEAGLFRGRIRCDANGEYEYETLVPANYAVDGAMRPAHIHVTVLTPERPALVTQMYFEGDPYLGADPLGLVREPLVCRLTPRDPDEPFRGRKAGEPFRSTRFDVVLPRGS